MAAPPYNSQSRGTASVDDLSTLSQISANIKAVEELSTVLDIAEVGLIWVLVSGARLDLACLLPSFSYATVVTAATGFKRWSEDVFGCWSVKQL